MFTELFFSHNFNKSKHWVNFHAEFNAYARLSFWDAIIKNGFKGPISYQVFQETSPRSNGLIFFLPSAPLGVMVLDDDDDGGGGGGGGGGDIKRAILFRFIHLFSGVWRRTSANGKVGDLTMMLGDWSHYSKLAPLQRQNKWYKYLFSLLIPSSLFNVKCGEFLGASKQSYHQLMFIIGSIYTRHR